MTFGALRSFVVWASNYPLGAKVWTFQRNTQDFNRLDEGISDKALTGATSSQGPATKIYFDAYEPGTVPKLVGDLSSHC